ncbi:hypothetical protein [Burkholderia ambifaria]
MIRIGKDLPDRQIGTIALAMSDCVTELMRIAQKPASVTPTSANEDANLY